MLKVTLYLNDKLDFFVEYMEGLVEPGGSRKVRAIESNDSWVCINFTNEETKEFQGFRFIIDTINEKPIQKKRK